MGLCLNDIPMVMVRAMPFLMLLSLNGCQTAQQPAEETGLWEGTVSIGPLCPVEPCNLTDARRVTIYRGYRLPILRENSAQPIAYLQPADHKGQFQLSLSAGYYLIRCEQCPTQAVGSVTI